MLWSLFISEYRKEYIDRLSDFLALVLFLDYKLDRPDILYFFQMIVEVEAFSFFEKRYLLYSMKTKYRKYSEKEWYFMQRKDDIVENFLNSSIYYRFVPTIISFMYSNVYKLSSIGVEVLNKLVDIERKLNNQ